MTKMEFDRGIATRCAYYSELVYEPPGEEAYEKLEFPYEFVERKSTEVLIVYEPFLTFVVPRGTQFSENWSWRDLYANVRIKLRKWDGPGLVHDGYADYAERAADPVNVLVKGAKPVICSGHSLGGTVVNVLSRLIDHPVAATYPLGAPRSGNAEFADSFSDRAIFRLVNNWDPAVTWPKEIAGYRHIDALYRILPNGSIFPDKEKFPQDYLRHPLLLRKGRHQVHEYYERIKED